MLAAGEVIKNVGCNVVFFFFSCSFIWGGVNSRVDIAIWLHNIDVGVGQKKEKKKKARARVSFLKLRHPLWTGAWHFPATSAQPFWFVCFSFVIKESMKRLESDSNWGKKNVWCGHQWPQLPLGESHGEGMAVICWNYQPESVLVLNISTTVIN